MSRERHSVEVNFVVNKPEHLPSKNGEQMYADDVAHELREVVGKAVDAWYRTRGKDLLDTEPLW
jgi:hypothetical protein